jgi:hypothetical protein
MEGLREGKMKEKLMNAFTFRYACKKFDESRKLAREDIDCPA